MMMSEISFTQEELDEFDMLTSANSSPHQVERIMARLDLRKFVAEHGKEKCDAMFAEIQARDRKKKEQEVE
jgi:hypothetical protein